MHPRITIGTLLTLPTGASKYKRVRPGTTVKKGAIQPICGRPMSKSHTPSAKSLGRRIRVMYVVVLVMMFAARMWTVHGVHQFFVLDVKRDDVVSIAGRLAGQSTEVIHAAFVRAYAPETQGGDGVDRAIGAWAAQHAKVAQLLARACDSEESHCLPLQALEAQMLTVAVSARAVASAPLAERPAALERLASLQAGYNTAAKAWVDELATRFAADSMAQR